MLGWGEKREWFLCEAYFSRRKDNCALVVGEILSSFSHQAVK
jgi:hypothetical protein